MSIIAGCASHRKGLDKSLFISRQAKPKYVLTAQQLREFALPGTIHRLIVPVVSPPAGGSRWAAGYGAVFAITVREGFIIAV
jgi:hypothetical protein